VDYRGFENHAGASTVRQAVVAIRTVTDADDELRAMLAGAVEACRRVADGGPVEAGGVIVSRDLAPSPQRQHSSV
jgi:hypothetical protein